MAPNARFLLLLLALAGFVRADPIEFDFSSLNNAQIDFDGTSGSLQFLPDTQGFDFQIVDSTLAGLTGLDGNIAGTFSIGAITSFGFLQDAPVTGSGVFSISDGSSFFTADITWIDVETFLSSGILNSEGSANLSNFAYSGTNAALESMVSYSGGAVDASFQFAPGETLSQLASGGQEALTSYSGSGLIVSAPETLSTAVIFGMALLLLATMRCGVGFARH